MTHPPFTTLIDSLPSTVPFVGPETQERQLERQFLARIGANESVFGPSPLACDAIRLEADAIWQYGDPENFDLKTALAQKHNVNFSNIVIGEGIDGLLGYLVRLFVTKDVSVVTTDGAYPTFNYHVIGFGGNLVKAPFLDDHEDPSAIVKMAHETQARLVYFSNPNNPMGTFHGPEIIQKMLEELPEGCLLCLDEAYADFVEESELPVFDVNHPQLIRFRTFSKAYGLAGVRVGYAITNAPLATAFNKVRNHFGMNRLGQVAALAALSDTVHLENVKAQVKHSLARIADIAVANHCIAIASRTNFIAIDCMKDGAFAQRVLATLISKGVFVRMPAVAPQNRCIRISAGTKQHLDLFETIFPKALRAAEQ